MGNNTSSSKESKIYLFIHPIDEHLVNNLDRSAGKGKSFFNGVPIDNTGRMQWNTKPNHARKFLVGTGDYLDNNGVFHENKEICFWGEWEPDSDYVRINKHGISNGLPEFVQTPLIINNHILQRLNSGESIISIPENELYDYYTLKQNTDPYVFGDGFMYSCCKQQAGLRKDGSSKMKDLNRGDIIIFFGKKGKNQEYKGYLDTVFVVKERIVFNSESRYVYKDKLSELSKLVSHNYMNNVILPICYGNKGSLKSGTNVLYIGASYRDTVDGMYSFFPCRKHETEEKGFKRFDLDTFLLGYRPEPMPIEITTNILNEKGISNVREYWEKLKNKILENYNIGVRVAEPSVV